MKPVVSPCCCFCQGISAAEQGLQTDSTADHIYSIHHMFMLCNRRKKNIMLLFIQPHVTFDFDGSG